MHTIERMVRSELKQSLLEKINQRMFARSTGDDLLSHITYFPVEHGSYFFVYGHTGSGIPLSENVLHGPYTLVYKVSLVGHELLYVSWELATPPFVCTHIGNLVLTELRVEFAKLIPSFLVSRKDYIDDGSE